MYALPSGGKCSRDAHQWRGSGVCSNTRIKIKITLLNRPVTENIPQGIKDRSPPPLLNQSWLCDRMLEASGLKTVLTRGPFYCERQPSFFLSYYQKSFKMISNKSTVAGGPESTLIPHPITHLCSHTEFEKRGRFFIEKPKPKYKANGKRASSMPAYKDRGHPQKEGQLEQGNTKWDPIVKNKEKA